MRPPGSTTTEIGELAKHLVLPAVTLAVPQIAITSRLTRSSFLQVISQDYIRTARAKGLRESMVLGRHALRNIMIPLVTIVGWQLGYLLSASILVETVFGWPGLGNPDGARGGRPRLPAAPGHGRWSSPWRWCWQTSSST